MGVLANAKKYLKGDWYWDDQAEHSAYDEYWKARAIAPHLKNVHCAVLTVGGLFDAEDMVWFIPRFGHGRATRSELRAEYAGGRDRGVHGGWGFHRGGSSGTLTFSPKNLEYFNTRALLPPLA